MTAPSFAIPNARVTRVTQRPKVSYLTLLAASDRQGMTTYFDVVCFATNGLPIPAEGASVSVTGTLGRVATWWGENKDTKKWTTELIARAIEAGDEGLTPVAKLRGGCLGEHDKGPAGQLVTVTASEDDSLIPF